VTVRFLNFGYFFSFCCTVVTASWGSPDYSLPDDVSHF